MDYDTYNAAIGIDSTKFGSLGGIISELLPYIFTIAGLVLLLMLIAGGFTMLSGATNSEAQEKGKRQITTAIVGFIIIFASYWIAQILQIVFKVEILG